MELKSHWERLYSTRPIQAVSWYQEHAERSLRLIHATGVAKDAAIIDIGGGASTLVDDLLAEGYSRLSVLDLSGRALAAARERIGSRSDEVRWIEADITKVVLPPLEYDLWHDRAVFHFLTSAEDRAAYVRAVSRSVKPSGHVIVATFAEDGPVECSGLPVARYSPEHLHSEFGESFVLVSNEKEEHHTPSGKVQKFVYCYCRRIG